MKVDIFPIEGIDEIRAGDDLATIIAGAATTPFEDGDVIVVAQKIVSKAEGRVVGGTGREEAAFGESARILRRTAGGMLISETRHGFVCANAGVDASNLPTEETVALLPLDPDISARRLSRRLEQATGRALAVIVADTFGRAWRVGQTNVAIGVAGIDPFLDHRGTTDDFGKELTATQICIADEIAAAAELVMGKTRRVPAALVRGAPVSYSPGAAAAIVRPPEQDLFR
jgi:coenzyme F420-0:L-glutamate ligase / coenzyme F420-1:gamma-L-glutamate ligase